MGGNSTSKSAHVAALEQATFASHGLSEGKLREMSGSSPMESKVPVAILKKTPARTSNIPNPFRRRNDPGRRNSKERTCPKNVPSKTPPSVTVASPTERGYNGAAKTGWKTPAKSDSSVIFETRMTSIQSTEQTVTAVDRNANQRQIAFVRPNTSDALNGNSNETDVCVPSGKRSATRIQETKFRYQSQLQQPKRVDSRLQPPQTQKSYQASSIPVTSPMSGVEYDARVSYGMEASQRTPATSASKPVFIPSKMSGTARASVRYVSQSRAVQSAELRTNPGVFSPVSPVEDREEPPPALNRFHSAKQSSWGEDLLRERPSIGTKDPMKPSFSDGRLAPKRDFYATRSARMVAKPSALTVAAEPEEKSSSWDYHKRLPRRIHTTPAGGPASASLSSLKPPSANMNEVGEPQPTAWKYVSKKSAATPQSGDAKKDGFGHRAARLEAVLDPVTKSFRLKPVTGPVEKQRTGRQLWFSGQRHGEGSVSSGSAMTSSWEEDSVDNDPKDELSIQFEKNMEIAFDNERQKADVEPLLSPVDVAKNCNSPNVIRLSDTQEEYEPKSSTSSGRDESDSNSPRSSGHLGPSGGFLIDDEIGDQPDLLTNSNDLTLSPCSNSGADLFNYRATPLQSSVAIRAVQENVSEVEDDEEPPPSRPDSLELPSALHDDEWSPPGISRSEVAGMRMVSGQGAPSGSLPTPGRSVQCAGSPIMNRTIPFTGQVPTPSRVIFKPPKPMNSADEDPGAVRLDMSTLNHMSQDLTYLKTKLLGLRRILDQSETVNPFDNEANQGSIYWYNLMHSMGTSDGMSPCRTPTTPDSCQASPFNCGRTLPPPPCSDSGDMKALQEENLRLKRQLADLNRQNKFQKQQLEEKDKAIRHLNCQLAASAVMYGRKKSEEEEHARIKANAATQTERPRNISLERMGNIGPYISSSPPCIPGALGIPRMSGIRSPSRGRSRSQNRV